MRQYRSEPRIPCNVSAELSWEIGAGYVLNVKATVRDTSKSGMGLLAAQPFRVGTTLKIESDSKTHLAVVRRCIRQGGGQHLVGVKIQKALGATGTKANLSRFEKSFRAAH